MFVFVRARVYYVRMYVYMYVRVYECTYVRTYIRMYVCMCLCINVRRYIGYVRMFLSTHDGCTYVFAMRATSLIIMNAAKKISCQRDFL